MRINKRKIRKIVRLIKSQKIDLKSVQIKKQMIHIFLFPVAFIYFEILLRLFNGTGLFAHLFYPVIFGIAAGLFCDCLTSGFKRKINRNISIGLLFGTGLIFIIECLVKSSFQFYMSFSSILTGAGGVVGGFSSEFWHSVLSGIPVIIMFFLPGILYIIFGEKKLPAYRHKPKFVITLLIYALIISGIGSITASIGSSREKYKTQFEFDTATQFFGLTTSLRLNFHYSLLGNKQADTFVLDAPENKNNDKTSENIPPEEETVTYASNVLDLDFDQLIESASDKTIASMHTYVKSLTPSKQNEYTGLFKGKNLILICAEALSDVVIDKEMTPTLYRMTHNGFYFSDFYQPSWGGSTSTGEYSFLTGLAPMNGVDTMQDTRDNNNFFTMGNQLQRQGYFSRCYHNGEHDFYSRNRTHTSLGYEQFLALGNGLEDLTGWWPRDSVMFDKTMDTYLDKQPFSVYYMTVSGHCVYKKDDYRTKENLDTVLKAVGNRYKKTTTYYLAYQMELEKAMTTMIEKLEQAGIADDTVICMTSDHYPYGLENTKTFGNTEDYVTDLYGYKYKTAWEKDHNALILWSGCLENENKDMACEIPTPTYSLDVVPTLANLFGLEFDSRLLVGRDVFSDAEPLVLWNNHSWITKEGKYNAINNTFTPNKGSTVDDAYVKRMKSIVSNKLTFSSQVLETDYYNVLFGPK